jgi:hypothetical protein
VSAELRDVTYASGLGLAVGAAGTIIHLGSGTGVPEDDLIARGLVISSGPNNGEVTLHILDGGLMDRFTAEVLDVRGRVVRSTGIIHSSAILTNLGTGAYLLQLRDHGAVIHGRTFVVAR